MKSGMLCKKLTVLLLVAALLLSGCGKQNTNGGPSAAQQTAQGAEAAGGQAAEKAGTESTAAEEAGAENAAAAQNDGTDGGGDENSPAATVDRSVYMDPSAPVEDRVEALLAQMTLEEKAAQMVQPEQSGLDPADVQRYGIGSVLSGGGSAPSSGNAVENWQERIDELKQAALESRLGIPLLYGVDAVHGNNNVFGATVFPHNIGLGAANDPELMEKIGEVTASEVRAAGIQWTFAPTLGNAQNERWGRTYECYSESAADVAVLGAALIRGLQGDVSEGHNMDEMHVIACAKHYIGEGYTTDGINQGDVDMTPEEFDALLESGVLEPYTCALDENVLTVMVSYSSVSGVKCHENRHLVQEILKDKLGFKGLVVSDYNGIQQTSGVTYKDQVELAVNAGVDLLMEPYTWESCMSSIMELVEEGRITQERLDDAVRRILYVKFKAGLFEEEIGGAGEQENLAAFGSEEHREVARQAVRESLVLLKNDTVGDKTAIDALKDCKDLIVSGQLAFDLGSQCGGWTISWQGLAGNGLTRGTTIIQGLADALPEGVAIAHNVDGSISASNDGVIAVVGEGPYAESDGDRTAASLTISSRDQNLLAALKENMKTLPDGAPKVLIIVAGRPLNITDYVDDFDAVVMAWLPGTEGEGVADVLLGEYDFTGTLKYTWMKSPEDIPRKQEEGNEELILFPYGTGLKKDGSDILQ